MEVTNQFNMMAKGTGIGAIEESLGGDYIEETAAKPLLSPMILR
eukprot:CAMPEP_0170458956 /NCGR_PEP_ID=MMETSP0123-20130129/5779_1 /TAXON_ID=182087 /ORGANISM="Favella ehrenbergii, Strain Fehren 1" /LENGTH=43 /DNA_ID=CAMNT_0010723329 /DNA_START=1898 /DNA_END=2029 /DNA_ORIENTATION=+